MTTLTIRNLDADIKTRLRVSAALHGCSMEEEVRNILRLALQTQAQPKGLGSRIHQRYLDIFGDEGAVENEPLALPARSEPARGVDFES
jgi:plasmid stability protein